MDDDEPLNLSTKSQRSNSNAIIWSPASICEKESASDGSVSIKVELDNLKTDLTPYNSQTLAGGSSSTSSPSCVSNASSIRTNTSQSTIPIHELFEKAHANTFSAEFFQNLQRRNNEQSAGGAGFGDFATNHFGLGNKIDFPSTLSQAAAAAAVAVLAHRPTGTNPTDFLSHLKQAEIDIIAKNQVSMYQGRFFPCNFLVIFSLLLFAAYAKHSIARTMFNTPTKKKKKNTKISCRFILFLPFCSSQ